MSSPIAQFIALISTLLPPGSVEPGFEQLPPPELMAKLSDIVYNMVDETQQQRQKILAASFLILNGPLSAYVAPENVSEVNNKLVAVIYEAMPHPPTNISKLDFRTADGADNLGKASMHYARSVPETTRTQFPDATEIFKQLMQRKRGPPAAGETEGPEKIVANPDGLSALTFAYGTLVIHSVFHSGLKDPGGAEMNETSSYFDLAPLYGDDQAEQDSVRNKTGRGLLAPDCFVDDRMLFLPPAAAALLVLFNRNHNHIAAELLKRNERGHWVDPLTLLEDPAARRKQDDEIFETARLINCFDFVNIVITDYVGGVMSRTTKGGGWPLNSEPLHEITLPHNRNVGRGNGNLVSIEFNILYRWHATLSEKDVLWAETILSKALGKPYKQAGPEDYYRAAQMALPLEEPKHRTFAGLVRGHGGYFRDADLANIIMDATDAPAGMFRACGSPEVMGIVDIRGILRARLLKCCTLNEFREWLGLPKYTTFKEWNADDSIATAASTLYGGDIDSLELYPGLHAEGTAGDGLDSSYPNPLRVNTMRNGLLLDAIALIRGDRFLTSAHNEYNFTPWGFSDVKRDPTNKANGGTINKLLSRNLPTAFKENSVYTWFPMTLPTVMQTALEAQGQTGWDFTRPDLDLKA